MLSSEEDSNEITAEMKQKLDFVKTEFHAGKICAGTEDLIDYLRPKCLEISKDTWINHIKPMCLSHELRSWVHQDPYTLRAFEKPRGYAGDAVMLDYIYLGKPPQETTPVGWKVFNVTTGGPNGKSVLARKDILAKIIDEIGVEFKKPKILSLACGHLREAQDSETVRAGKVGEFFALDQDEKSLSVVQSEQKNFKIKPIFESISSVIRGKIKFSDFQLVYTSGLFDYLSDPIATKLCTIMFKMLASGGKMVISNFRPTSHGRGYMSSFMDWSLVYRDTSDLQKIIKKIPFELISSQKAYQDPHDNVAFLELQKK